MGSIVSSVYIVLLQIATSLLLYITPFDLDAYGLLYPQLMNWV